MPTDVVKVDPTRERVLDRWVANQLVERAVGKDETTQRNVRNELQKFAADLAGPNPSPIERVLADTAALAWFAHRTFEAQYLGSLTSSSNGLTIQQSEHAQRRIDRLHRRLLSTLRALATVRKLALPNIQVNVGAQQVNVSGPM